MARKPSCPPQHQQPPPPPPCPAPACPSQAGWKGAQSLRPSHSSPWSASRRPRSIREPRSPPQPCPACMVPGPRPSSPAALFQKRENRCLSKLSILPFSETWNFIGPSLFREALLFFVRISPSKAAGEHFAQYLVRGFFMGGASGSLEEPCVVRNCP